MWSIHIQQEALNTHAYNNSDTFFSQKFAQQDTVTQKVLK